MDIKQHKRALQNLGKNRFDDNQNVENAIMI
jgi:hypothetical protein